MCTKEGCERPARARGMCMRDYHAWLRKRGNDKWLLPTDGIIDLIAVDLASRGVRLVCLTREERRLAVFRIIVTDKGAVSDVMRNIGVTHVLADALAAATTQMDERNHPPWLAGSRSC